MKLGVAVFGLLATLAVSSSAGAQDPVTAHADMADLRGRSVGGATLGQTSHGVLITVELKGLPPGWHALHIHQTASCQPPFASAGGHFNPSGESHGYRTDGLHAGDLPNIFVGVDGKATAQMISDRIALKTDRPTEVAFLKRAVGAAQDVSGLHAYNVLTGDGTALIVHAGPDDYRTDPAGNSGDRIACGVIRR